MPLHPSPILTASTTTHSSTPATYYPSPPSPSKWRVTPSQKATLQSSFDHNPYPDLHRKVALASQLGVTTVQVSKWFQHRRETLSRLGQFKAQYNRTRRTPHQLDILNQSFQIDRYPTAERLAQLEAQLDGVTAKQIKLWFKHRRKKIQKRDRGGRRSSTPSPKSSHPSSSPPITPAHRTSQNPSSLPTSQSMQPSLSSAFPISSFQPVTPPPPVPPSEMPSAGYPTFEPPSHNDSYRIPSSSLPTTPSSALPPPNPNCPPSAQFSPEELMVLRGAHAVTESKPSADGVARLAHFLRRPHGQVAQWFNSQSDGFQNQCIGQFVGSPCLTQSDAAVTAAPFADASIPTSSAVGDFSARESDADVDVPTSKPRMSLTTTSHDAFTGHAVKTAISSGTNSHVNRNDVGVIGLGSKQEGAVVEPGSATRGTTAPASTSGNIVTAGLPASVVHNNLYPGYMYPSEGVMGSAAPAVSPATLAPLRYGGGGMSTQASNGYMSSPAMWYSNGGHG